jgi:energy-coupling factor transporter ATP-binding protein EcfA2
MQNFELILTSPVATSFRATKAANSLDIDAKKKSEHHFKVQADVKSEFSIGLIVGASGSGKTTLAKHIWGNDCFKEILDVSKPVIEQFPETMTYDEIATMLCGVGLTSVPCWIRPAFTLSNGQKARAECALQMSINEEFIVIDEWTSVVDRTVAKVMSHCIQKYARKTNKKIVLLSCHYDVIEWLNPDWVIDANKQEYENRRLLWRNFRRTEQIEFSIYETNRSTWPFFSQYHYLNEKLAGGKQFFYGLWCGKNQIGFLAFTNYVPFRKDRPTKMQLHFNRLVIHPDYCGFGLGIHFLNKCSDILHHANYEIMGKFSSMPVYNALKSNNNWRLNDVMRHTKIIVGGNMKRGQSDGYDRNKAINNGNNAGFRLDVKTYSFKYKPNAIRTK